MENGLASFDPPGTIQNILKKGQQLEYVNED